VVIQPSSASDIARLIADLIAADMVGREAAAARLAIIGDRAVNRLLEVARGKAPVASRVAALAALEAIGSPRALDAADELLKDITTHPDIALAALSLVRSQLPASNRNVAARALDRILTVALEPEYPEVLRSAAAGVLHSLPRSVAGRVLTRLTPRGADGPSRPHPVSEQPACDVEAALHDAAARTLPDDPERLRRLLLVGSGIVSLGTLQTLIDRVREHERLQQDDERRARWMAVRGALHQALGARGSRLGLYDLRESFESAHLPLPIGFVAAASVVGDGSCLEPIAVAYARSAGSADMWWRTHLRGVFSTIVAREGLTRRHAVVRKALERGPGIL
jgi:hypothetical protein